MVLTHCMLALSAMCIKYSEAQCLQSITSDMISLKPSITQKGIATPSIYQQLVGLVSCNGYKALELHHVAHQGNDVYVPDTANNIVYNIEDST